MASGSVLATPAWALIFAHQRYDDVISDFPSDQYDHARLGLVTRFYCSTQPGGLQPAIATGRSVVAQAPALPRVSANPRVRDGGLRGIHAVWADRPLGSCGRWAVAVVLPPGPGPARVLPALAAR